MFRFNLWARPFMPPSAQGLDGNPFFPSPIALPPGMTLGSGGSVNPASGEVTKNGLHNVHDKDKDGSNPYAGAFPLFRPGEALPHALYSPIHQQFLRAQLELANAHHNSLASQREAEVIHPAHHFPHTSAFAPTKRQRIDDRVLSRDSPSTSPRSEGGSPHSTGHLQRTPTSVFHPTSTAAAISSLSGGSGGSGHLGRVGEGELSSPLSQSSRTSSPRDADGRRSASLSESGCSPRAEPQEGGLYCPICRANLPAHEMTAHLSKEIYELQRMGRGHVQTRDDIQHPCRSRYETFLRIRGNREGRLGELSKLRGLRHRKRVSDEGEHFLSNGLDDSFNRREEEEHIDVLSCDDPETNTRNISESNQTDKPHDLSRKSVSPTPVIEEERIPVTSPQDTSLCCSGCTVSFTKVTPVTSMKCWHVRCDACWRANTNNLDHCPQCNISMTAEDLRRIFL